mmetsp:Transcript_34722/g.82262  ORF Transcript_34722/g.82262 Transcript_34722/m.82262 type:complete len:253 (-) Transcript_34722:391-1149(-)
MAGGRATRVRNVAAASSTVITPPILGTGRVADPASWRLVRERGGTCGHAAARSRYCWAAARHARERRVVRMRSTRLCAPPSFSNTSSDARSNGSPPSASYSSAPRNPASGVPEIRVITSPTFRGALQPAGTPVDASHAAPPSVSERTVGPSGLRSSRTMPKPAWPAAWLSFGSSSGFWRTRTTIRVAPPERGLNSSHAACPSGTSPFVQVGSRSAMSSSSVVSGIRSCPSTDMSTSPTATTPDSAAGPEWST